MRGESPRSRRSMVPVLGTICLLAPIGVVAASAAPVGATTAVAVAVDLGTLGGSTSFARGINDAGVVVGWSQRAGDAVTRAFRWTSASGMHGLGTLGGDNSQAAAVNEVGQVVGWSQVADGSEHAFIWTVEDGMLDLGTLGGPNSRAVAINDHGVVVGMSDTPSGPPLAFVWDATNGTRALGLPDYYRVTDINNAGQVVGSDMTAFVWDPVTGLRDLGVLADDSSGAQAINDSGEVVGDAEADLGPSVAVLWSPTGEIRSLGTLPASGAWTAGCCSGAFDISENGRVVGYALVDGDDVSRAFVWDASNGMRDLGTLGGEDATAYAINTAGQIAGESLTATDAQHATLWTLVTDTTPPVLRCTKPAPRFLLHQRGPTVVVSATVSDDGSGPAKPIVSKAANTSKVGRRTAVLTGSDMAGNSASVRCAYTVTYRTSHGFFRAPVDGNGVVNVAKAGRTIPVRWRITDVNGVPVTDLATVTVTAPKKPLPPSASSDAIEHYTTGRPGLVYKGDGVYQYNWKVPAGYAGTKRVLTIDLGEGVLRTAVFRFTR